MVNVEEFQIYMVVIDDNLTTKQQREEIQNRHEGKEATNKA